MATYIEQRYLTWYATLTIPAELRAHFGRKRFFESLKTTSKRVAIERARALVVEWKGKINTARGLLKPTELITTEAMRWRKEIEGHQGDPEMQATLKELLQERAVGLEDSQGADFAQSFFGMASGRRTPSMIHFESWKAQLNLARKTQDQMIRDVSMMIEHFPVLEGISKANVKGWTIQMTRSGCTVKTQARILSFCRNYWRYLQQHDVIPHELQPFHGVLDARRAKQAASNNDRQHFTPEEVVRIWKRAREVGDEQLADLIQLAAYTGARIEELCSMRTEHVTEMALEVKNAKTKAATFPRI